MLDELRELLAGKPFHIREYDGFVDVTANPSVSDSELDGLLGEVENLLLEAGFELDTDAETADSICVLI